ncbi:hypothetical protein FHL15_008344 [Xylaria flabelliformis]|uniref:Homeobox domain-containing protein n=1 Tax=Xylaria flabelliformis TaxID=2512241 RepID=A0A553HS36_9PEZI|nr:hypothetical protein FHL15_008344 [Xylaria flabelliformis]
MQRAPKDLSAAHSSDLEQLVPELQRDRLPRTPPSATSPTGPYHGPITPPDYVISPNQSSKRRRVSSDEEAEYYRASEVPRPYTIPRRVVSRPQSPCLETRLPFRPWVESAPSSPHHADYNMMMVHTRSPDCANPHERTETRRAPPPSYPVSNYEPGIGGNYRGHSGDEYHRTQGHSGDEYMIESSRRSSYAPGSNGYSTDVGGHGYRPPSYHHPYGYHHPSRTQSLSVGSAHLESRLERTPFSSGGYYHHETYMRVGSDFSMGPNGEGKQRKRRGNLPKETTEILRNWFFTHLAHPYPTEDEKQALMRETNLQMNQISNWFINARRRQLPNMINSARAEADAMKGGRSADGKCLPSSKRHDHDHDHDHEGGYEPERHRTPNLKRGSI